MPARTHLIRDFKRGFPNEVVTFCGKKGYQERSPTTEFSTDIGNRFEATSKIAICNCGVCIRAKFKRRA